MKRLDSYIFIVFTIVVAGVLAVGGATLVTVHSMMDKTHAIEAESRNVDFVNHLHNKTYSLMLAIREFMAGPDQGRFELAAALSDEVDADLQRYLAREQTSPYPEAIAEIRLLEQFLAQVRSQRAALSAVKDLAAGPDGVAGISRSTQLHGVNLDLDKSADAIYALTREINRLHFAIITRKVEMTRDSVSTVVALYLLFGGIGVVLLYTAYDLHSRFVVRPIKRLAEGARKVAAGDLRVRVRSGSRTEIGVLCRAFDSMVATLQANEEKLLEFNRDLERKVRERTQALETTHASLRSAQEKLIRMEKLSMLGQIATSVNHEIRTPLNALYMNLQLIKKALQTPPAERGDQGPGIVERVALIDQEVTRISDILEEFVRYARIAPPNPGPCDLNRLADHVADLLGPRAEQTGVRIELALAEPPPQLLADENKLLQVLVNLGVNAIHAMPQGGTLTIATADRADTVELSVSDTGIGIPAEDMGNIFQPFFSKNASGLGFGLAIMQRIVEDHGGQVACRSQVGAGTCFTVRLPKTQPVADDLSHALVGIDS